MSALRGRDQLTATGPDTQERVLRCVYEWRYVGRTRIEGGRPAGEPARIAAVPVYLVAAELHASGADVASTVDLLVRGRLLDVGNRCPHPAGTWSLPDGRDLVIELYWPKIGNSSIVLVPASYRARVSVAGTAVSGGGTDDRRLDLTREGLEAVQALRPGGKAAGEVLPGPSGSAGGGPGSASAATAQDAPPRPPEAANAAGSSERASSPAHRSLDRMTEFEARILEVLTGKRLTQGQIASRLGRDADGHLKSTLSSLVKRGILRNEKPGYVIASGD